MRVLYIIVNNSYEFDYKINDVYINVLVLNF